MRVVAIHVPTFQLRALKPVKSDDDFFKIEMSITF